MWSGTPFQAATTRWNPLNLDLHKVLATLRTVPLPNDLLYVLKPKLICKDKAVPESFLLFFQVQVRLKLNY